MILDISISTLLASSPPLRDIARNTRVRTMVEKGFGRAMPGIDKSTATFYPNALRVDGSRVRPARTTCREIEELKRTIEEVHADDSQLPGLRQMALDLHNNLGRLDEHGLFDAVLNSSTFNEAFRRARNGSPVYALTSLFEYSDSCLHKIRNSENVDGYYVHSYDLDNSPNPDGSFQCSETFSKPTAEESFRLMQAFDLLNLYRDPPLSNVVAIDLNGRTRLEGVVSMRGGKFGDSVIENALNLVKSESFSSERFRHVLIYGEEVSLYHPEKDIFRTAESVKSQVELITHMLYDPPCKTHFDTYTRATSLRHEGYTPLAPEILDYAHGLANQVETIRNLFKNHPDLAKATTLDDFEYGKNLAEYFESITPFDEFIQSEEARGRYSVIGFMDLRDALKGPFD